jgi:hypothetical protein
MAVAAPPPAPVSVAPRPHRSRRSRRRLIVAVAAVLVLAFAAFATYKTITTNEDGGPEAAASTPAPKYDLTKVPDILCDELDATALLSAYETQEDDPRPARNLTAQVGTANCELARSHQKSTIIARIFATATIRPDPQLTAADYQLMVAGDAKVNDTPQQIPDLGDEAVIYRAKNSSVRAGSELVLILGLRESNLMWQLRLSVTRQDNKGWTDAEIADLRGRLITVTKATLPKLTATLT